VNEGTLFWSLSNTGVNGEFGPAADLIDDDRDFVMDIGASRSGARDLVKRWFGRLTPRRLTRGATTAYGLSSITGSMPSQLGEHDGGLDGASDTSSRCTRASPGLTGDLSCDSNFDVPLARAMRAGSHDEDGAVRMYLSTARGVVDGTRTLSA
jgi:hypothetical protein